MDEVLEVAGVKARHADKREQRINIIVDEYGPAPLVRIASLYHDVVLTPNEARRLARQLNRFARRIEERDNA